MHMASYYLKLNLRGGPIWITRHPQKLASLPVIPCNWSSSKENLQSAAGGHYIFLEGAGKKKHPQQNGNSNNRFSQTFHTKNQYTIQHNSSIKSNHQIMNKHHSSKSPPTPTSQLLFFLEPRQLNQSPPISGFFHPVRHRAHSLPQIGSVFWVIPILLGVNMLVHTYISSVQYLIESTYVSHDSQVLSEEWPLQRLTWDFGKLKHTLEHNLDQSMKFPTMKHLHSTKRSRVSDTHKRYIFALVVRKHKVALNCPILLEGML